MISIYDSSWRGLGGDEREQYVKLGFDFRNHLHLFSGAKLAVFMSLTLHCDREFRCRPSLKLMQKETGYSKPTIIAAIDELCKMEIDGQRILCKWRKTDAQGQPEGSMRYKILPTPAEVAWADAGAGDILEGGQETLPGGKEILPGGLKNLTGGGKNSLPEVEPIEEEPMKNSSVPAEPVTAPARKKASKAYTNEQTGVTTNAIRDAYLEALDQHEPGALVNHGETAKWAKTIAQGGYTPEQVKATVAILKAEEFWKDRHLSLGALSKQIAAKVNKAKTQSRSSLYQTKEL